MPSSPPSPTPRRADGHSRALWRLLAFGVFLVSALAIGLFVPFPSVPEIRSAVGDSGVLGATIFAVGYALITLLPVPKSVMSVAAGLIWGIGIGSLLVYLAAILGAALAFLIGRLLGRDAVERLTGARIARVDELLRRRGLVSVIAVRLVPVIPFTVINYAASLSSVSRRNYFMGTAIGIIPGTLSFVALGASGFEPGPALYLALGFLALLTIGGAVVAGRAKHRRSAAPEDTA